MGRFDFTIKILKQKIADLIEEQGHINIPETGEKMKEISRAIDSLKNPNFLKNEKAFSVIINVGIKGNNTILDTYTVGFKPSFMSIGNILGNEIVQSIEINKSSNSITAIVNFKGSQIYLKNVDQYIINDE